MLSFREKTLHMLYRRYLPPVKFWKPLQTVLSIAVTFAAVSICWVFFRADNISSGFVILRKVFTERGQLFNGDGMPNQLLGIFCIMILFAAEIIREIKPEINLVFSPRRHPAFYILGMALLTSFILLTAAFHGTQFIYFQF